MMLIIRATNKLKITVLINSLGKTACSISCPFCFIVDKYRTSYAKISNHIKKIVTLFVSRGYDNMALLDATFTVSKRLLKRSGATQFSIKR